MVYYRTICALLTLTLGFSSGFPLQVMAADMSAPIIVPTVQQPFDKDDESIRIGASVNDDQSLSEVVLHYRTLGSVSAFESVPMERQQTPSLFEVILKGEQLSAPGLEYYIEARDGAGNISQQPFPSSPTTVAIEKRVASEDSSKINWLWVGLGVLVVGALAGGGGGGSSSSGSDTSGNSLTVSTQTP